MGAVPIFVVLSKKVRRCKQWKHTAKRTSAGAIISYLQDGRPQSSSAFIFLSHNAPFQPLGEHNNFNPEFHKYLRRAGIAIPTKRHTGVHTIRHSFATNMLRKGTPVQDVSQILGHSNISVTETYLRVDIEHMRLCSLSLEGLL